MDKEKVLTWLELCGKNNICSGNCPYSENGFGEYGTCRESLMAGAYDLLKEQPEIVKCKDCAFRDPRDGICEHVQQIRDPDWYCADGVRRDDDG